MDSRTLQIILQLKDEASSAFGKFNDTLKANQDTIKGVGVAAGVAFAGIVAFGAKAISDYGEAEASAKQLEHAVIDVSHATKEQLDATSALADELERKGVLDGDNIKMGLAQLSTFGLSNNAVQGLGKSLSDLAVNQFGVTASGDQLSDSANMIAKALNGQFGVLEKSGIRFSDTQQHMIKFGTEMEKVKAINEGFAQNLKYTNDVALTTMEGKLAKANVQVGNISEALGQSLQGALQNVLVAFQPFIQATLDFVTAHPKLVAAIFGIVAAVTGLTAVVAALALATVAFSAVAWPVVAIVVGIGIAIGALIAVGVLLYQHWDEMKAKMVEVFTYIGFFFQAFWENLTAVGTFAINLLVGSVITILNTLVPGWQTALTAIITAWNTAWKSIGDFFTGIWDGIKTSIGTAIDYVIGKINELIAKASEIAGKVLGPIQSAVSAVGGAASGIGKSIGSAISSVASTGAKAVSVHDAVVTPSGQVIHTDPADYLFATKTPDSLRGGSNIIININGGTYLDSNGARMVADLFAKSIGQQLKTRAL